MIIKEFSLFSNRLYAGWQMCQISGGRCQWPPLLSERDGE
jgi:hypothetical protein